MDIWVDIWLFLDTNDLEKYQIVCREWNTLISYYHNNLPVRCLQMLIRSEDESNDLSSIRIVITSISNWTTKVFESNDFATQQEILLKQCYISNLRIDILSEKKSKNLIFFNFFK